MDASIPRRTLTALTYFLGALFIAGAFISDPRGWGFDHWAAFPTGALAVAALILAATFSPWGRNAAIRALHPLAVSLEDPRRVRLSAVLIVVAFATAFWFGRERTFLLSDGELLIRGIEQKLKGSFEADLLSFQIQVRLRDLFRGAFHVSSLTASFRLASLISGIVWLAASFAAVGRLTARGWERLLLGGLLATLGFTRLFYGYVETSPLLAAASAIYLWRAVVFLKTGKGAIWVSLSLLLAITMHLAGVLLLPSYLFLVVMAPSRENRRTLLLTAGAPLAIGAGYLLIRAGHGGASISRLADYFSNFLPVTGPLGPKHAYTLLSPDHWNDFLQQQLLLGPFALIAMIVLMIAAALNRGGRPVRGIPPNDRHPRQIETFLLWQVVPVTLASFFYGRKLGAARDWDLLAGAAPAAALWVGLVVIRAMSAMPDQTASVENVRKGRSTSPAARKTSSNPAPASLPLQQITVIMLAVSLFHLVPWILVDAERQRSIRRFETLLSPAAPLSRFARAYGYEELGRHYLEKGDLQEAKKWFGSAVETDPSDVKALAPLAHTLKLLGEPAEAIRHYQAVVRLQPAVAGYHFELAEALRETGRAAEAIAAYRAAVRLDPARSAAWLGLGNACFAAGQFAAADSAYAAGLNRDPGSADLWFNRGLVKENLGDNSAARQFYEKALAIAPDHRAATFALGTLHLKEGRPAESIPYFEKLRQREPGAIEPAVNLALAQAYLGQSAEVVNRTLASIAPLDARVVHAYMDAAMILAAQGRSADALALLNACVSRDEALARSNGVFELISRLRG